MNIFENAMDAYEFTDAIAEKIVTDWGLETANLDNLYYWIQHGFAASLKAMVKRRIEG